MTPDQERWAEALAIECIHGADAPRFIAERIGAVIITGDVAGVQRLKDIAGKLDELARSPTRLA